MQLSPTYCLSDQVQARKTWISMDSSSPLCRPVRLHRSKHKRSRGFLHLPSQGVVFVFVEFRGWRYIPTDIGHRSAASRNACVTSSDVSRYVA